MAIDIRANVTCSLGELVSGSLSDGYIQGNGLVKTKGQCELVGLHTPVAGTAVTFSYTREGTTHQVPRRLRVLSSFADPFRNITKVELGCLLTYMEGVGPTPTVDGQSSKVTGRQQQCLNGYTDYPADSKVPIPISAAGVMNACLARIGITASSNPLTNRFLVDEFDLAAGYVSVLGDLLVSESYFGYLDESEVLQVRDLAVEGGGGPVLDASSVIDVDQIGVGDLPGDAVVVRFDALKLSKEPDLNNAQEQRKRDWEEEETTGSLERHVVRYTNSLGATVENVYTYIPYQKTVITYGKNNAWDPATCVLASAASEGADLSDSPAKSVTTERILSAEAAGNYYGQILTAGATVDPSTVFEFKTKETEYKYDDKGELVETTVFSYEPMLKWAGGLDLNFVYATATGTEWVLLGTASVLVEKTVTKNENIYAPVPAGTYIKPGEELVPVVEAQKVTTEKYVNWALTPQGQQAIAQIKDETPFASASACLGWLTANSTALVLADAQVQINRGRDIVQGQTRAKTAERIGAESGSRGETTAQLMYATGGPGSQRTISMSMPYQSDDCYSRTGQIIRGDAASKALRYGRTQNRLLMGNRYGVNVQLHADRMPAHPYDPLYLSNGSLMVQYRANGANWAFSKDGVVASLDALFWGVAGGTGTSWVPVAPGVTGFPPLPAVDANGNANVPAVVPPWNESVPLEGVTRTTALVTVSDYLHSALSETVELVTKTKYQIGTGLLLESRTFLFTGYPAGYKFTKGMLAEAGTFNVYGQESTDKGFYVLKADAALFDLDGLNASKKRTFNALAGDVATFAVTGYAAGSRIGINLLASAGTFNVTGQDAGKARHRVLSAAAGTFTTAGQDVAMHYTSPSFNIITYTGNQTARAITGVGFEPSMVWIHNQAAVTDNISIFDQRRGAQRYTTSYRSGHEYTDSQSLLSFDADGFSLGTSAIVNNSSPYQNHVAYCWKGLGAAQTNTDGSITTTTQVSTAAGFSLFTYTGNATTATVGHGLGDTPEWVIIQQRNTLYNSSPQCHSVLIGTAARLWALNSTAAATSSTSAIRTVGATTVTVSGATATNGTSLTSYIGIAFKSVPGVSKLGVATGDGSGVMTVDVGFFPRLLIIKTYVGTGNWWICRRTSNAVGYVTHSPMNTNAAATISTEIQITSTGFSIDPGGDGNVSGSAESIWYMAYA